MFALFNVAAYQIAWFAVLIGAARGIAWVGVAAALLVCGVHCALRRDAAELRVMAACLGIGAVVDSALAISGVVQFAGWSYSFAPYWMLSLWMAFATTLNHSLRWLMTRRMAAAAAGAVGGPLAYLAGARLGALDIAAPATALPLIALLWTAAMFALSSLVSRQVPAALPQRVTA